MLAKRAANKTHAPSAGCACSIHHDDLPHTRASTQSYLLESWPPPDHLTVQACKRTEHKAHQGLFAVQTPAANCSKQLPHLPMHQAHEGNKIRLLALDLSPITTCYAITSQRLTPHKLAREVHPASASERYANGATQLSTGFNTWIGAGCASFHTLANWSWYLQTASRLHQLRARNQRACQGCSNTPQPPTCRETALPLRMPRTSTQQTL